MNFQEEFQFLLKNLSEKDNESKLSGSQKDEHINRTRRALANVINYFITDFDKMSQSMQKIQLTPIFNMIGLYIEQYSELFIKVPTSNPDPNELSIQRAFTNFLVSRLMRILANPSIESLHMSSSKGLVSLMQTISISSSCEFNNLLKELIETLEDLMRFNIEFYEEGTLTSKRLARFNIEEKYQNAADDNSLRLREVPIDIEDETTCELLQTHLVQILNELIIDYISTIHSVLYEKLWHLLCQQIELGDYNLKKASLSLALSMFDLRIIPLRHFDFSSANVNYLVSCVVACIQMLFASGDKLSEFEKDASKSQEFDEMVYLIVTKIFNEWMKTDQINLNQVITQLSEIICEVDLMNRSDTLRNTLFYLLSHVTSKIIECNDKQFYNMCLLNDIINCLINYIGKFDSNYKYLNMSIAQALVLEIEIQQCESTQNAPQVGSKNENYKIDLNFDKIKTVFYMKLVNKAKLFLSNNKQPNLKLQECEQNSIGLNSILEILTYANYLFQTDNFLIEECQNIFSEGTRAYLFQTGSISSSISSNDTESIYLQLILYWISLFGESRSPNNLRPIYQHALHTIKNMISTSVEWKKQLCQTVLIFISIPWLAHENNGMDLELFKDRSFKQLSTNLLQNITEESLTELKCYALSLLCLLSKNTSAQWRTHVVTKCLREDKNETVRRTALKYLPYLIYNLGVASNSLVFQLIHPAMCDERSIGVLEDYAALLDTICCLMCRKCFLKRSFNLRIKHEPLISAEKELNLHKKLFKSDDFAENFELICTCCDKTKLDRDIHPQISKEKNKELIETLLQRPKYVDSGILIQFFNVLNADLNTTPEKACLIQSRLLHYLERAINHLEMPRNLHAQALQDSEENRSQSTSSNSNKNLTIIYKESMNLFANESLNSLVRANFSRFSIPKLTFANPTANTSSSPSNSIESLSSTSTISDLKYDLNFNLESQLCDKFLKAKSSENVLNEYLYIISLGRYALSLKCDEYLFVSVKHLLEIFDSSDAIASSLAQRQLFILSKQVNMQELLSEFSEKLCEIISDTIFNSINRQPSDATYLQDANYSLKDVLKVFNINDSCLFIRTYQKYLVPHIVSKASANASHVITKSLEFLARKINSKIDKLIEDNFPHIFTYTSLNSKDIANVFKYISKELRLDIDKLITGNKQRLFNELLSRCGNSRYKLKVWHAIRVISANTDDASLSAAKFDEKLIVKHIEPNLLAALIHFDMCLMRSSVNIKEKCQVLESLNVLMGMLGVEVITKVRYKMMTTLKLAMQQCGKYSELTCKLWDTFVRNVDKVALGPILNQIAVNVLQLLEPQPFKTSKILEYLIIENNEHMQLYFNELYFMPEHAALDSVNKILHKHISVAYILERRDKGALNATGSPFASDSQLKALAHIIKHYLKGATHENADLRVKALENLYGLLKNKSSLIGSLVQRENNSDVISEIVLALLNGCRDSDIRAKLLFGCCLGEIGALDPATIITSNSCLNYGVSDASTCAIAKKSPNSGSSSGSTVTVMSDSPQGQPTELYLNPSLIGEDSAEFSEFFSRSLIMELSKAYLAARNTHEQDSASYAIQEALKIYGCSASDAGSIGKMENKKLWSSFPDYIKEILTPLRTSKYEIQSFDNFTTLKTPIILSESECKSYEEWVYKWCAYLISKLQQNVAADRSVDKEVKIFPKLLFIIRFNVNVALFILPYIIIKIIMNNYQETIDQIYEEMLSVVQMSQQQHTGTKMALNGHICCQTVFNIHDHLMRQLNYYRTRMNDLQASLNAKAKATGGGTKSTRGTNNEQLNKYRDSYEQFNRFIQRVPQQLFSKAALECKAYCRSLMYYEIHMRSTNSFGLARIDQSHLNELQTIYASMDDIDAACGTLFLRKGTQEGLADAAFRHKINGRLNEAIACMEQILESDASARENLKQHESYVCSFISVGRHRNALSYLDGLTSDRGEWRDELNAYKVEACWKLGAWDKLNTVAAEGAAMASDHFNAGIGRLFSAVDCQSEVEFGERLRVLREQQIGPLTAVSMEAGGGSYQRGYEYVVNLHILQEIESTLGEMFKLKNEGEKDQYRSLMKKNLESYVIGPWERRVEAMQPSYKALEPIYNVRIALLNFISAKLGIGVNQQMAKLWLRLAKISRKAGMFENAYQYMLNAQGKIGAADTDNLEELLVEKAKWYWQREDKDSALFYLQKGLNELFAGGDEANSNSELYSKVLLMYTKFSEENGSLDSETIRRNYAKVQKMCSKMEQSHFQLAQFTDRLGMSVSENTGKKEKLWEYLSEIITYYANSLEYGCQYIYQSLPRMMSLWLDFGADYFEHTCREASGTPKSSNVNRNLSQLNAILQKLNQIVTNALQRLPTYTFLTVYSQLVSRICHPEERVSETLSNIIMKVLFVYPQQAIWMLIAVKNSSVEMRKNRCKVIVDKAIRQQPDLRKFISDSSELAEKLVQLGNLNVDTGVTQLSLASCFKPLKRLVESKDFSRILIPSQFQITLQLPSSSGNTNASQLNTTSGSNQGGTGSANQSYRTHNPYPIDLVYIYGFEDSVSVMNSLQKPKKVTIRGTDGKMYSFLCKAKDDLRIDYRVEEFFSVVNKCLKQEPESRRRNLYIRTYAVTPLNEFCGIIEWIDNLTTLRSILIKLYNEKSISPVTSTEWRSYEDKISKDKDYALKVFKMFLERYSPSVLHEWFLRTFPEPNMWYNARLNYVRTAAVMSVCGYVVGLGDRHCENILMASSNGDCIHVDFNCLFNKGESLGVPEIVPFRLTNNLVEAMGPLGYEGIYRKMCEVTMKILRDYKEPLITILKTFIYDPLVEWKTSNKSNEVGETISAKGQLHLQNITSRLKGMHARQWASANTKIKALPLSVEGHVNTLIKEATDEKSLSLMYIGWAAFY